MKKLLILLLTFNTIILSSQVNFDVSVTEVLISTSKCLIFS